MKELARQSWLIYRDAEKRGIQALVRPSIPILFFGDHERYFASPLRIITVGLNPSRVEFPQSDRFARFPAARGIDPSAPALDLYLQSLRDYFRERPYDAWFKPAFEELLRGLGASYYDGAESTALHTDICTPLATDPTWSRLKEQHAALAAGGGELWHNLVERLEPHVILISVARQHLDTIRFRKLGAWTTVHTVERANPFSVQAVAIEVTSAKETLLVFGRAANLPFGTVSGAHKRTIGEAIRRAVNA
jgi:hypothetical protein